MQGNPQLVSELLRTLPLAAAVFDRDMVYVAHNERWLPVHGEPADRSLVGRSHYDVFPDLPEHWREIHRLCLGEAVTRTGSDVYVRADGRREYVEWSVVPWRAATGDVAGLIIYAENIGHRVRTEQRLAEREGLIRELFEHSPVGLNLCRMDGLWLESNPAFLDIIGYSPAEADGGLTYWQLTPRRYDADEAAQLENLRTHRRYGPYEKEFIRKDGRLVPVRLNGFLISHDGQDYIWSLVEDLTTQRELEAKLEEERVQAIQASKLATLGEMAASFAHEINNPLGIIDAYAFTLPDAIASCDQEYVAEAVRAIRVAAARAGKIVHGLRKFARQPARDPFEDVAIESIVDDALDLCQARIRSHGVELAVKVETEAKVHCNAIELSQVIVNLLNNAFDAACAGPAGHARWIRLTASDGPDATIHIVVDDSGAGVASELETAVFRPFFTTKQVGAGTGLGLSISRVIVERHGGTLALDRDVPHTRFRVILPRVP